MMPEIFNIETDGDNCWVDIWGVGTVAIQLNDDGVVVDLFPLWVRDEPVTSTWATYGELIGDPDAEKVAG